MSQLGCELGEYGLRATVAEGEERARIWQQGLRVYPGWSQYERRASHRRIAIFVLGAPAA